MPEFPDWERVVLEHCYGHVDALSIHLYVREDGHKTLADYLACPVQMENQIRDVLAACDFVRAKQRHKKTMMLSFDEWNVWDMAKGNETFARWATAPRQLENIYTFADALVVAGMLLVLLRQSARVRYACMAQLVNVIAPIMTAPGGGAWRQTIFHPLQQASRHGRGVLLATRLTGATSTDTPSYGASPDIEAVATRNGDALTVFVLNRGQAGDTPFAVQLDGATRWRVVEHQVLTSTDTHAINTAEAPAAVAPRAEASTRVEADGTVSLTLPPLSWHVLRLAPTTT